MSEAQSSKVVDDRPLTFRLALWCGNVFAWMFILYGGVKLVLAFLDNKYDEIAQPITFLVVGLVLIAPVMAYKDLRTWGYWGMVGVFGVVAVLSVIGLSNLLNLFPLLLSLVALVALFSPVTKAYVFER